MTLKKNNEVALILSIDLYEIPARTLEVVEFSSILGPLQYQTALQKSSKTALEIIKFLT